MTDKKNYTGKTVYMGIDVPKKTYCCASICEGEVVKRDTMPSSPEGLLYQYFPGATVKGGVLRKPRF